jgi:hypothetical protein
VFGGEHKERADLNAIARHIKRAIAVEGTPRHGYQAFRRGIASNLYALGVSDKIIQRVFRHSRSTVTKEHYIKTFEPAVIEAMQRYEKPLSSFDSAARIALKRVK